MIAVAEVNDLPVDGFAELLGGIFEHAPWVARAAWEERPFARIDELHAAMVAVVRAAPRERQLALIAAHPELADPEASAGQLTASSAREQAEAGLDRLPTATVDQMRELNRAYRERFGFPLVICVREHSPASILAWGQARLQRDRDAEITLALSEIAKIARARLEVL